MSFLLKAATLLDCICFYIKHPGVASLIGNAFVACKNIIVIYLYALGFFYIKEGH